MTRRALVIAVVVFVAGIPSTARAQATTVYHLHAEASLIPSSTAKQLKTAGPDAAQTALQSPNEKGAAGNFAVVIANFETQAGVPNRAGTIAAGSVVSFTLRMKVTRLPGSGSIYPHVVLRLDTSTGPELCRRGQQDGLAALTTTLTPYTFTCTTGSAVTMTTSSRFFLETGVWIAGNTGNQNLFAELDIETNADSTVTAPNPAPAITSLSVPNGIVGDAVTITGTAFGTSGTVTFNGTAASTTTWTATSIQTTVPSGVAPGAGPVVVTVNGLPSNGSTFTALPHIGSVSPASAAFGDPITITGTTFGTTQGSGSVKLGTTAVTNVTSWNNTSIGVTVPSGASSGQFVVTAGGNASNGAAFTLLLPNITSLSPPSGAIGQSVTVAGTHFGATQGASTIAFNGTGTTPTFWSNSSITAPAPVGATTGPVVVTVGANASNGATFTVITTGTIAGAITRAANGTALSGATIQAVLTGITRGTATSAADGSYSIGNLDPGAYDVRVLANTYSTEVRSAIAVAANITATVNVAMLQPGTVSGRVTQADGVTPLSGAAVTVYAASIAKGTASTNGTGDYAISGLHPGAFTVQAADVGYTTKEQGAAVAENAITTSNFALLAAPAGPVLYAYDELNRLVEVTDPAGESAIYRYDAVGNITGIERPGTTGVAISAFSPNSGPIGTSVTIFGTGFSTTAAQDTVTFGGTPATVTSAMATQIVATVPAGLAPNSYTVGVTTAGGSATRDAFVIPSGGAGAPTISSFSPTMAVAGTPLTINGTNFNTQPANDYLRLNASFAQVTSATTTALQTTIPGATMTGRVDLATPNGEAVSSSYLWVPPPPYGIADIDTTGTLTFGSATVVSTSAANKIALRVFDGLQGHRASIKISGATAITGAYLYDALGTVMQTVLTFGEGLIDVSPLRATATYSVVMNAPYGADSATLTLYDVPADFTATIAADGAPVSVPITTPGQNAILTFSGTAGQRVSLKGANGTIESEVVGCDVSVSIVNPDLSVLAGPTCMEGDGFIDATTLPTTGTYTILVDPSSYAIGTLPLSLYTVTDYSGTIVPGGSSVTVPITTPGQNGALTFSGSAGERVSLAGTGTIAFQIAGCDVTASIVRASDNLVVANPTCMEASGFIDAVTLPTTDTYRIVIDPASTATGNLTLTLYDVPPDGSGSLSVNATPTSVSLQTPGQNATFSFTLASSAAVTVRITSNTITGTGPCVTASLTGGSNPSSSSCGSAFDLVQQTLAAGTYTVKIDPVANSTGSLSIQVTSP
jgi:YD repeat-containing protein